MPTQLVMLALDSKTLSLNPDKDYIARIPIGLNSESRLFDALAEALQFPSYFGANRDALSECLRDLSWIPKRRVAIVHDDVPQLDARSRAAYFRVLSDCVADWEANEDHELLVVFRGGVNNALSVLVG